TCSWNPCPNASRRLTAVVPQTMPNVVMNVRSFCVRRSRRSCLSWTKNATGSLGGESEVALLLRRPLDHQVPLLEPRDDLAVQAVGEPGLDLDLLRLCLGRGARNLDEGLLAAVLEGDDALGNQEDVLLLPDDEVGVGRIPGAQHDGLPGIELDLHL